MGYACFKGMKANEAHNSPDRILKPLKKQPDGSFVAIKLEQALDEIAQRISRILQDKGPEAIAGYKGGGAFFTASSVTLLNSLLAAMGSAKMFSSVTIDQSSKAVAMGRIGTWPAGRDAFHRGEVLMLFGANPLLTLSTNGFDNRNPMKRLKGARERGMKLIVIDPRETETARFADVFIQPLPGEDHAILAAMLNLILTEGWQDSEFCQRYAGQLDELRAAVAPFTLEYASQRAEVPAVKIREATELFARDSARGSASSATGPDMSRFPNLAEHLIEALNVVCGRFIREGEEVPNPGVLLPRYPRNAEVLPAQRWWEEGYKSRVGNYGVIDGELPTGIMAEEILQGGEGQVKCLLVHGGNPASAVPDQHKIVKALKSLDLLVTIEPFMTMTAQLSDYILPPTLQYERADLPLYIYEHLVTPDPYTRYTPAVASVPAGAEVCDDAHYLLGLGRRLNLSMRVFDQPLNLQSQPTTDQLLEIATRHAPCSFSDIKKADRGLLFDRDPQFVGPRPTGSTHLFSLMPEDVAEELQQILSLVPATQFKYRMASRRMRDTLNSACKDLPSIKARTPRNPAFMNPQDMQRESLMEGDPVVISSERGEITLRVAVDPTLRCGVVSIAHGFGSLAGQDGDSASTNLLISTDRHCATINAMPRMSGIPINIKGLAADKSL